ncbi:MAG TPA: hypothetical protein VN408_12310 [Actinoplanes sp.]|nr:hypothetical protein [Actinoplanes sp.]
MTIAIGTSTTPTVYQTHAAWLRLRENCNRLAVDVAAEMTERRLSADKDAVMASRDAIARMTRPGLVDVLV